MFLILNVGYNYYILALLIIFLFKDCAEVTFDATTYACIGVCACLFIVSAI